MQTKQKILLSISLLLIASVLVYKHLVSIKVEDIRALSDDTLRETKIPLYYNIDDPTQTYIKEGEEYKKVVIDGRTE